MSFSTCAFRASLIGAAASVGLFASSAMAQDGLTLIDIDQVLAGEGILEIDLNSDEATDFFVEIVRLPVLFPPTEETPFAAAAIEISEFILPTLGDGQQATEVALITAASEDAGIVFAPTKSDGTPFAATFMEGDIIGEFGREPTTSQALLYYDTVELGNDDAIERSFGPFDETGDNAFIGLSLSGLNEQEDADFVTNFGFLEITRGSITVGQQGFQTQPFEGAQIGAATVPLPAPLAFLAVAILGLFGMRRFKA